MGLLSIIKHKHNQRSHLYFAVALSLLTAVPGVSQSLSPPGEVLETYRKLDAAGGRLSPQGWYSASRFFVKPEPQPQEYVIGVMKAERIYDAHINGKRAEVHVTREEIGQIDSLARFTYRVGPRLVDASGRISKENGPHPIYGPVRIDPVYIMILTEAHWELGFGQNGRHEVKGSLEWRLEYFEYEPWVRKEVAIQYLTKLRDESNDNLIKHNADASIHALIGLE